ncbi:MAG: hypothetical protein BWY38_03259 [Ignavibacteria bacterium ADurb.Bin266]|nr:MAG: hypothetical protein BWY38_03259 [Ignavibacteria bacterium ADurb.Bin266]
MKEITFKLVKSPVPGCRYCFFSVRGINTPKCGIAINKFSKNPPIQCTEGMMWKIKGGTEDAGN